MIALTGTPKLLFSKRVSGNQGVSSESSGCDRVLKSQSMLSTWGVEGCSQAGCILDSDLGV